MANWKNFDELDSYNKLGSVNKVNLKEVTYQKWQNQIYQ